MSSKDPNIDEYTLLCERCGYVVEGLPTSGACPECGKGIEESLPGRRVGSRWQSHPGRRAIWLTNIQTLRHPLRTFDSLRIERSGVSTLPIKNFIAACLLPAMAGVTVALAHSVREVATNSGYNLEVDITATLVMCLVVIPLTVLILVEVLVLLTQVEQMGIRFFGRRRGWRITSDVAFVVCAHASVGWIVGGVIMGGGLFGICIIAAAYQATHEWQPFSGTAALLKWFVPISALCGLLAFESLVFIGVRRCKFANRIKPPEPAVFKPVQRGAFRGKEVQATDVA